MYEIALCDDDAAFAAEFERLLADALNTRNISYHLTLFADTSSLQSAMENGTSYHLLFLDILFDTEQGIRFGKFVREQKWNTDIIFVTTAPEYAIDGYDAAPLHYLLKPVSPDKLDAALERFLHKNAVPGLCFTTPKGLLHVQISEILYFEIYGHEITIHKTDGQKETCTGTLKDLEELLPPMTFVRPHRSYLVNFDHISEISRYQIRLFSGDIIPISKNLYNSIQNKFIDYASQKCLFF